MVYCSDSIHWPLIISLRRSLLVVSLFLYNMSLQSITAVLYPVLGLPFPLSEIQDPRRTRTNVLIPLTRARNTYVCTTVYAQTA